MEIERHWFIRTDSDFAIYVNCFYGFFSFFNWQFGEYHQRLFQIDLTAENSYYCQDTDRTATRIFRLWWIGRASGTQAWRCCRLFVDFIRSGPAFARALSQHHADG